ncbi:helix-turn-helix domain-containing protein [Halocatena pleomorpha]|uniref:Helix-turn-helix domain-containing protein n=1 Tax=Halocatena pleomorpha TaxID=1785090 RepID=A0A3P3RK06_9EURY|nr:helix-turn-helix domain-containing protein [Halocatena pleomorpha]RRJ33664.1 helix-turn-helix domain-containing protein [Halocatena pleomorpha]
MDKLADISGDRLLAALEEAESAKATKRLMIALAYKDGVSVDTLSTRYGLSRSTVYSWLDRFESRSIEAAIEDDSRPGRPPKLDDVQQAAVRNALDASPTDLGYEQSIWTPELLQKHIEREHEVSYSLGHVRRIIRELSEV